MSKLQVFIDQLQRGATMLAGQPDMDAVVVSRAKYLAVTKMLTHSCNLQSDGSPAELLEAIAEDYFKCTKD